MERKNLGIVVILCSTMGWEIGHFTAYTAVIVPDLPPKEENPIRRRANILSQEKRAQIGL